MQRNELKKTNACRVLDGLGIAYDLRAYEVDEADLSAVKVARSLGLPVEQMWKTLCLRADDQSIVLALVAGDMDVSVKALAKLAGKRAVAPVAMKELPALTGYIRGGVTALACKKPYPVFVDETVMILDQISVSAGQRGLQIVLAPADYVRATAARLGDIAHKKADFG